MDDMDGMDTMDDGRDGQATGNRQPATGERGYLAFGIVAVSATGCRHTNEYHERMMRQAYDAMLVNPERQGALVAYSIDEGQQRKYEQHRGMLVARGVLFEETYVFANVRSTTERASAVVRTLLRCPPCPVVDFASPHTDESQPLAITLWARQEDKEEWDRFMRGHDAPAQPEGGANSD